MSEELEAVLRLVADGRLTPEEAAPIIDALTRAERAGQAHRREHGADEASAGAQTAFASAAAGPAAERQGMAAGGGRRLRIRVTERGRQVVNLRIPIGLVDRALGFVPGLGGDQAQRIRDAVNAGDVGPILDVEDADGEGGVLISVE